MGKDAEHHATTQPTSASAILPSHGPAQQCRQSPLSSFLLAALLMLPHGFNVQKSSSNFRRLTHCRQNQVISLRLPLMIFTNRFQHSSMDKATNLIQGPEDFFSCSTLHSSPPTKHSGFYNSPNNCWGNRPPVLLGINFRPYHAFLQKTTAMPGTQISSRRCGCYAFQPRHKPSLPVPKR